jgi:hypothetical protein
MRRLFSSFAVKVQVSDEYVMTGLIIVLVFSHQVFQTNCVQQMYRSTVTSRVSTFNNSRIFQQFFLKLYSGKFY